MSSKRNKVKKIPVPWEVKSSPVVQQIKLGLDLSPLAKISWELKPSRGVRKTRTKHSCHFRIQLDLMILESFSTSMKMKIKKYSLEN